MLIHEHVQRHYRRHTRVVLSMFAFLRTRSPDLFYYKWVYPSIILIFLFSFYFIFVNHIENVGKDSILKDANSLFLTLFGFYVAAAAVISNISGKNLDERIKGAGVYLKHNVEGEIEEQPLTRRRFLAILFGYCAVLSVLLYAFGFAHVSLEVSEPFAESWKNILLCLDIFSWVLYFWAISSLLVSTFLGLYYLFDRMHRP